METRCRYIYEREKWAEIFYPMKVFFNHFGSNSSKLASIKSMNYAEEIPRSLLRGYSFLSRFKIDELVKILFKLGDKPIQKILEYFREIKGDHGYNQFRL